MQESQTACSLPGEVLCDFAIMELDKDSPKYPIERSKIEHLESICSRFGRTLRIFCMSEFYKSGAMLSCLIMPIRQLTDAALRHPANCHDADQVQEGDNKLDVKTWAYLENQR